ncbi:MAG TPA: DNA alkylation repair protein [bacterium]|nr:DNA alkylation repair protein [bacterium]
MYQKIIKDLEKLKNPAKAKILQGFFKTGLDQYGEGDVFLGITVPEQRQVAKKYLQNTDLADLQKMLNSKIHEHRLVALLILVAKFNSLDCHSRASGNPGIATHHKTNFLDPRLRGNATKYLDKKKIFEFYLKNTQHINNWDLVDLSAPNIVGKHLFSIKDTKIIYKLVRSKNLWERRISVLATFTFIKENQFADALKIAKILLTDKHDLIHKAVGWMLREIGKRDVKTLEEFLNKHYKTMPRTMLRYAIEKLDDKKRKFYLNKT